ncbi:MAG TPA: DNA primase [Gemmatimonadales bacterium]|nr:DNA primase [Gemmatimonadales bacterium]
MSLIPDEVIEQVRDAADLVALVGESVDLKRSGGDYRGACPFHGGTHRNFAVIPKKGMYYCYVCHAAGDAFSYLMKRFGLDYPTAVREVARRAGIAIPETGRAGPDPREPLFGAVAAAHDWFVRQLAERDEGRAAREYLGRRDVTVEQAAQHGLGWAPAGPAFLAAMRELGLAEPVLLETGLAAQRDDGRVVARFRDRLLFPIHDLRGRAVGFGGRLLGDGEPKYLNSPETPLFSKGRLLYNLHAARPAIRQHETVLVVEGYFDVLRLVLAGVEHVVAPLGTGLTPDQAGLLRRVSPVAILLYDSDTAGLRATFRAGDELLRHGVRVRVATLPAGEDPDSLVRAGGADALAPVLRDAVDVLERKLQLLDRGGWFGDLEHRRQALDKLLPTIRAASDAVTRELYATRVAERLGVSREVVLEEARSRTPAPGPSAGPQGAAGSAPTDTRPLRPAAGRVREKFGTRTERRLVSVMLAAPEWRSRAAAEVDSALIEHAELRALFEALRGLPPGDPGESLPDGLPAATAGLWSRLRETATGLGAEQLDDQYAQAVEFLRARSEDRAIDAIQDLGERTRRRAQFAQRFPTYAKQRLLTGAKPVSYHARTGDAP